MKKYLISLLFFVSPLFAQTCASPSNPFPGIGTTYNVFTGTIKAWLCLNPDGTVITTGAFTGGSVTFPLLAPDGLPGTAYSFSTHPSAGMSESGNITTITGFADIILAVGTNRFVNISGSGSSLAFNGSKGQHIQTFSANNDIVSTCTLASGTCTFTFTLTYTSAPVCTATPTTTGTFTTGATLKIATTTTTYTVTSTTGTDTALINVTCISNPT